MVKYKNLNRKIIVYFICISIFLLVCGLLVFIFYKYRSYDEPAEDYLYNSDYCHVTETSYNNDISGLNITLPSEYYIESSNGDYSEQFIISPAAADSKIYNIFVHIYKTSNVEQTTPSDYLHDYYTTGANEAFCSSEPYLFTRDIAGHEYDGIITSCYNDYIEDYAIFNGDYMIWINCTGESYETAQELETVLSGFSLIDK